VRQIVDSLQNEITFRYGTTKKKSVIINHVIGTQYITGDDFIGFHDDKMKDIAKDSLILILSVGERRELHLQDKDGNLVHWFVMEPGSLFILGPKTNGIMRHSLVKVGDEKVIQRKNVHNIGVRISLCLRHITSEFDRGLVLKKIQKAQEKKEKEKLKKENEAKSQKRQREDNTDSDKSQTQPKKKEKSSYSTRPNNNPNY